MPADAPQTPARARRPGEPADVDWEALKALYERGMSMGEIARRNGVTRQAVGYRAKVEGWKVAPDVQAERKEAGVLRWLERVRETEIGRAAEPRTPDELDPSIPAVAWGRDFHCRAVAHALAGICEGEGEKVALAVTGIDRQKWNAWQKVDKSFQAVVMAARGMAAQRLRKRIDAASEYDWKAAQYLLEKTEETVEFVHQPDQGAGPKGITVNLNIARDESVAISLGVKEAPKVIDITPEKPSGG